MFGRVWASGIGYGGMDGCHLAVDSLFAAITCELLTMGGTTVRDTPSSLPPPLQTMRVMRQFTVHTLIAMGVIVMVHLTTFITTVVFLLKVKDSINDLDSSGKAFPYCPHSLLVSTHHMQGH